MKNQDMYLLNMEMCFMWIYQIYLNVVQVLQNMNVIIVEKYPNVVMIIIIVVKKKMVKNFVLIVPKNYLVQINLIKRYQKTLYLLKNGV